MDWKKIIGLYGPDKTSGTTGIGPDYPESAGDRERGKFRPSAYPRLTQIAVTDDEGEPILKTQEELLTELILEIRTLRHAMIITGLIANIDEPI